MQAIRVPRPGDSAVMVLADVPRPVPGPGEVVVAIEAAGVNFLDIQQRLDRYPGGVSYPYTPGVEGAGTVVAVGPGVADPAVGERVAIVDVLGCYADAVRVPAGRSVRVPDGVDARTAAAVLLQGLTAHVLLDRVCPLRPGDWVLIHAGAGGTGRLLIMVAKTRGATVVATVSTPAKAAVAKAAGADHVIVYVREDFVAASRALPGFPRFAAVFDSVGPGTLVEGLALLRTGGMMVSYGKSAGPLAPLDLDSLNRLGSLVITRPNMMHFVRRPEDLAAASAAVFADVLAGRLSVLIGGTFPLARAAEAQDALAARATTGKLLILPGTPASA